MAPYLDLHLNAKVFRLLYLSILKAGIANYGKITDLLDFTYKTRVKQPLLQAAQDLREPSGSDFSKTSENNTEK